MLESAKTVFLVITVIYAIVLSVLYYTEMQQKAAFQKDKILSMVQQKNDLDKRESIIVDKEICFRELTKLKTIHTTAMDVLKSYVVPSSVSDVSSNISSTANSGISTGNNETTSVPTSPITYVQTESVK